MHRASPRRRARFRRREFFHRHQIATAAILFGATSLCVVAITRLPTEAQLFCAGIALLFLFGIARLVSSNRRLEFILPSALVEEWTSREFRRLGRYGWTVLEGIFVEDIYIHHVVVGPAGVFAVDTVVAMEKWNYRDGRLVGPPVDHLPHAIHAATVLEKLVHRVDPAVVVVPTLIIWGPGAPQLPGGQEVVHGVAVVIGRQASEWRVDLRIKKHDANTVAAVVNALKFSLEDAEFEPDSQSTGPAFWTMPSRNNV